MLLMAAKRKINLTNPAKLSFYNPNFFLHIIACKYSFDNKPAEREVSSLLYIYFMSLKLVIRLIEYKHK